MADGWEVYRVDLQVCGRSDPWSARQLSATSVAAAAAPDSVPAHCLEHDDGALGGAAGPALVHDDGVARPPRPDVGVRYMSRKRFEAAVVLQSESQKRSVYVRRSDSENVVMACPQEGCEYLVAAKLVSGGHWKVTRVTVGHACQVRKPRGRQYRADVLVAATAPLAVRNVVSVMGRKSNRAKDLINMVTQSAGVQLHIGQAHNYIAKRSAASKTAFLDELQVLPDFLRQMREQDPEGNDYEMGVPVVFLESHMM